MWIRSLNCQKAAVVLTAAGYFSYATQLASAATVSPNVDVPSASQRLRYVDAAPSASRNGGKAAASTAVTAVTGRRRAARPPGSAPAQTITQEISAPGGGTVSLANGTRVMFPPYTFASDQLVTVAVRAPEPEEADASIDAASVLGADLRTDSLLIIDTGYEQPLGDIVVAIPLPPALQTAALTPVVFAQELWSGELEEMDAFQPLASAVSNGVITTSLSPDLFTDGRDNRPTFNCPLLLGSYLTSATATLASFAAASSSCPNLPFGSPFIGHSLSDLELGDGFGPRKLQGGPETHDGLDIKLPSNETVSVQPVAPGCIEHIGFSITYGQVVIVKHADGRTRTLYAHLEKGSVSVAGTAGIDYPTALANGASSWKDFGPQQICVNPGTAIGHADSTGRAFGPHLHFEIKDGPIVFGAHGRLDPEECVFHEPKLTVSTDGTGKGTVEIQIDGRAGRVTCGSSCVRAIRNGRAALTAVPDAATGAEFRGWHGVPCDADPECPIAISADTSAVATFNGPTCSAEQLEGGDIPETRLIDMGKTSGTFVFSYNTYVIPDEMIVSYEGRTLFDSGCVGESRDVTLTYSGSSTLVRVEVRPNCAGDTGTAWDFVIGCPQ